FKKSSCAPLEFFLHFSGIAACTKQMAYEDGLDMVEIEEIQSVYEKLETTMLFYQSYNRFRRKYDRLLFKS
ncbi:hypothetical protein NPM07_33470, partial [Bacillus cereus]|nr:hypothetical protein [Bacillus cereus]